MNCPLTSGVCYGSNCGFYGSYGCAIRAFGTAGADFFYESLKMQEETKAEIAEMRQDMAKEIRTIVKEVLTEMLEPPKEFEAEEEEEEE